MAESLIAMTEGSGKNGHTFQRVIGANTVEDSVVLLGEQYLASYTCPTVAAVSSTATANSHLYELMAGASLKVRVRWIAMYQYALATAASRIDVRVMRLSTAGTGGTAHGFQPRDSADAAAGATAMTLPTVKGTEGVTLDSARPYMLQTIAASADFKDPLYVWDFDRPRSKPLIIAAGAANGICIKNIDAVAGGSVFFVALIDETNFL